MHFTFYITWFKILTYKDTPIWDIALPWGNPLHMALLCTRDIFKNLFFEISTLTEEHTFKRFALKHLIKPIVESRTIRESDWNEP